MAPVWFGKLSPGAQSKVRNLAKKLRMERAKSKRYRIRMWKLRTKMFQMSQIIQVAFAHDNEQAELSRTEIQNAEIDPPDPELCL